MDKNIINVIYEMDFKTNAGTRTFEEEANVTGFIKVMFSIDAIVNIFALRDLNNFCRVAYHSANQDAFVAHMDKKQVIFQCNEQGLYIYNPDNSHL